MPFEIVQQIFTYLGPKDFNAARHTCRNWMRASLDKSLLQVMLTRGGWWSSAADDLEKRKRSSNRNARPFLQSEEWLLSRNLSRQCALTSDWTGNGLDVRPPIVETCDTDFTELANGSFSSNTDNNGNLVFSASVCGRFILAAKDTLIYVYDMRNGSLLPISSVVCPRRVLSMSMDTSADRHAVAALLEGRMGMICELSYGYESENSLAEAPRPGSGGPACTTKKTGLRTTCSGDVTEGTSSVQHATSIPHETSATQQEQDGESFSAVNLRSNGQVVAIQDVDLPRRYHRNLINQTWNLKLHAPLRKRTSPALDQAGSRQQGIPIETGASTFYRHLCSEDDPPRSVSICPQRRCVAFGCSAGIELHWIDALTGQSLSR
jgi:hypothetical protein